jgi:hypothetical protein
MERTQSALLLLGGVKALKLPGTSSDKPDVMYLGIGSILFLISKDKNARSPFDLLQRHPSGSVLSSYSLTKMEF